LGEQVERLRWGGTTSNSGDRLADVLLDAPGIIFLAREGWKWLQRGKRCTRVPGLGKSIPAAQAGGMLALTLKRESDLSDIQVWYLSEEKFRVACRPPSSRKGEDDLSTKDFCASTTERLMRYEDGSRAPHAVSRCSASRKESPKRRKPKMTAV